MTKGKTVTVNGQSALEVVDSSDGSIGYVTVSSQPELIRVAKNGQHVDFSQYNAVQSVSPPPASEVVDLTKLGNAG
jgi:hypothetical protein